MSADGEGSAANGDARNGHARNGAAGKPRGGRGAVADALADAERVAETANYDPPGFEMRPDGLWRVFPKEGGGGGKQDVKVCGPFRVLGETRGRDGSEGWGLRLTWRNRDGEIVQRTVMRAALVGDGTELRAILADGGLYVGTSEAAKSALRQYLAEVRHRGRLYAAQRCGWYDDADGGAVFLYPGEVFGQVPGRTVFLDMPRLPDVFRKAGTLAGWKAGVARAASGNSRMIFAISAAFSGPLLAPSGEEGSCFHLRGASSRGKTTAAKLAASVYGAPSGLAPFIRKWRSTDNAVESMAAEHSDSLLVMDEIGQADPKTVGDVAYMLADGQGKARAKASGGLRAPITWRVQSISTGEESLADYMARGGRPVKAGQEVRFLDVPIEAGGRAEGGFESAATAEDAAALAKALEAAAVAHHGHAGPHFLAWLAPQVAADPGDGGWLHRRWRDFVADWLAREVPPKADGQVGRAARRFALVAMAGEMATEAGATGWQKGEAMAAAATCFRAWLAQRGGIGGREGNQVVEALRTFILAHGQARFETLKERKPIAGDMAASDPEAEELPEGRAMMHRAGWRWQEQEANDGPMRWVFGIAKEVFDREIAKPLGLQPVEARNMLAKAGAIMTETRGGEATARTTIRKRVPGMGRQDLVVTWGDAISGDEPGA